MKQGTVLYKISLRIHRWLEKKKVERDKVDKMIKVHEDIKDHQRNSPAGFEAIEVHRHRAGK